MTRRRYVQLPSGELVEVGADFTAEPRPARDYYTGDRHYDGLRATDGTPIDTRTKHREYMRQNGLTTIDDFKGEWDRSAKARADYYTGRDSARRVDVERAIAQLETKDAQGRRRS